MTETPKNIHELAKALIEASVEHDSWDESPTLILMTEDSEGKLYNVLVGSDAADPFTMVVAFASTIDASEETPPFLENRTPKGVALISEAWGVAVAPQDINDHLLSETPNEEHPDRVEMKVGAAFDGENWTHYRFDRGSESVLEEIDGVDLDGSRLPAALGTLFNILVQSSRP